MSPSTLARGPATPEAHRATIAAHPQVEQEMPAIQFPRVDLVAPHQVEQGTMAIDILIFDLVLVAWMEIGCLISIVVLNP